VTAITTRGAVYAPGRPELRELQRRFDALFAPGAPGVVLDVGCGKVLPVDLEPSVRVVGMDVSPEAMAGNANVDEMIVGDAETYPLPQESFDAVLCWDVLEHLRDPASALRNMCRGLRPGGVMLVGVPYFWSLKALVAKFTPHWFHVWVYRRLLGYQRAGAPGQAPFRTYLRREIAPRSLVRLLESNGLELVDQHLYGGRMDEALRPPLRTGWSALRSVCRVLTLGRYDPDRSELYCLFQKPRRNSAMSPPTLAGT
jgi:SAM-dependent methyltransferase